MKRQIKPSTVLKKNKWSKKSFAIDKNNRAVCYDDKNACGFCMIGAAKKALLVNEDDYEPERRRQYDNFVSELRGLVIRKFGIGSIPDFNDYHCRSKAQAIRVLKEVEEKVLTKNEK